MKNKYYIKVADTMLPAPKLRKPKMKIDYPLILIATGEDDALCQ